MGNKDFFGEYNNIYFLTEDGKLSLLCDRAHRKRPVRFAEGAMEDLASTPRVNSEFSFRGVIPGRQPENRTRSGRDDTQEVEVEGNHFRVTGQTHSRSPAGFGLGLKYQVVAPESGRTSALLTLTLPDSVRYSLHWEPIISEGPRFVLPENMSVTVLTSLPWRFEDGTFVVETEAKAGEVTFLVESFFEPSRVQQTVILTAKGRERDALLARSACGGGFVPCFVLDKSQDDNSEEMAALLKDIPYRFVLSIGLRSTEELAAPDKKRVVVLDEAVDLAAEAARLLGQPASKNLVAPDKMEAYGPALFLALQHSAILRFKGELSDRIRLEDSDGHCLQEWLLPDLLGVLLEPPITVVSPQRTGKEIVVCESVIADLLVCQAIGYADLKGCPIAFLPPFNEEIAVGEFLNGSTGIHILETETAKAVPLSLRAPDADVITIFTRGLPLHLTPIPSTQHNALLHWVDRYILAHLPGQIASHLVPRLFKEQLNTAPPVPFAVIFDALGEVVDTEGNFYATKLARGLSYPIVLPKHKARREILREILQRLDTDLLLLITHGSGHYVEDGSGDIISDTEIAHWALRGAPVVFNNSCASWVTTGRAFLNSGARAFIGTLWPVANDIAVQIATKIGERLHAQEKDDLSTLLVDALRDVTSTYPVAKETAAAYIYIGLPGTQLLTRPFISTEETIALLAGTFQQLYNLLNEIALEGRPDLAIAIQQVVTDALRQRFIALLIPGELPCHLPWPMSLFSVLEIDFLLASANFDFGKAILSRLPHEQQLNIVAQMHEHLRQLIYELTTWDERHDKHLGRSTEERNAASKQWGMKIGALGERGFVRLAAGITLNDILPFVSILAGLHKEEAARSWFNAAAKMVTTPADLLPDGSVTDEALICRIREGIREEMRVLYSRDDPDAGVWIDHLENAVNKSDLANRFGIACLHLKDYGRAINFFEAARDLASPGSEFFANATSNLSNALRKANRYDQSMDGYLKAFTEQELLRDYRNAMITAANMLRTAARAHRSVDESIMRKTLTWAGALPIPGERVRHECDLFGASACYYASFGRHDKAAVACKSISNHLQESFPTPYVAVHLNELAEWYYENGQYSRAAKLAFINATALKANHLPDVATRTYSLAGECALRAYSGSRRKAFLSLFFECSQEIGRALHSVPSPSAEGEFARSIEGVWENTHSLWEQLAANNERVLALQAYKSVKAWDANREDHAWELLSNAYHPRNREAIRGLAENGELRRQANLTIHTDLQVVVEVDNARRSLASRGIQPTLFPEIVFGYLPLYDDANWSSPSMGRVEVVAGAAVYLLRDGESITIREENVQALRTDGHGTFLYQEVWGSRLIPYQLSICLAPGLIPLELEFDPLFGPTPTGNIQFDQRGCRITLEPGANHEKLAQDQIWLAEVRVIFRRVPGVESAFGDPSGPFSKEVPFSTYSLFLRLMSPKDRTEDLS